MRISEIHIDGFGIYHDFTMQDLADGMNIVIGDNEAGKSTFLAFMRTLFFGFLDGRSRENLYPPLRGGLKGGRIVLINNDQEKYVLSRYAEGGEKGFSIIFPDGREHHGDDVLKELIGPISREVFQNIFAFSLNELQRIDSLDKEGIHEAIYSASIGTGAMKIAQAEKQLAKQQSELFLPGSHKREINKLLTRIEDANKQIRTYQNRPEEYNRLSGQLADEEQALQQEEENKRTKSTRLERVKLLLQGLEDWTGIQLESEELQSLPKIAEFPVDGISRLDKLLEQEKLQNSRLRKDRGKVDRLKTQIEALSIDETLLACRQEIQELERKQPVLETEKHSSQSLGLQIEEMNKQIAADLEILGPEWSCQKAQEFDSSIPVRDVVRGAQEELSEAKEQNQSAERDLEEAERRLKGVEKRKDSLAESLENLSEASALLGVEPHDLSANIPAQIKQLERELVIYQKNKSELANLNKDIKNRKVELEEQLRNIGPDWNEEKLARFDTSLTIRGQIRKHKDEINASNQQLGNIKNSLADAKTNCQDSNERYERIREQFRKSDTPGIKDRDELNAYLKRLKDVRSKLNEKEKVQNRVTSLSERLADLEQQAAPGPDTTGPARLPSWPAWGLIVTGLVLLITATWAGSWALASGIVLVVVGVLYFLLSRKLSAPELQISGASPGSGSKRDERLRQLQSQRREAEDELGSLNSSLVKATEEIGHSGKLQSEDIDSLEEKSIDNLNKLNSWLNLREKVGDNEKALRNSQEKVEKTEEKLAREQEHNDRVLQNWRDWLVHAGLREDMDPDGVMDLLQSLEKARVVLKDVGKLEEKIRDLTSAIEGYQLGAGQLLDTLERENPGPEQLPETIDALAEELKTLDLDSQKRQSVIDQLREAQEVFTQEQEHQAECQKRLTNTAAELAHTRDSWQQQLQKFGFRHTVTPEGALEIFARLEKIRSEMDSLVDLETRQQQCRKFICNYHEQVSALCRKTGSGEPAEDKISLSVQILVQKQEENTRNQRNRQNLQHQVDELENELKMEQEDHENTKEEIRSLLQSAGTTTEEEFRQYALTHSKRLQLEDSIKQHEDRLRRLIGANSPVAEFKNQLATADREALQQEKLELEDAIEASQNILKEKYESVGEHKKELEQLEVSEVLSELHLNRESMLADLNSMARKWSVLKLTSTLIEKAREKYERERRPDVLKDAERFFKKLTGDRYRQVNAPLGERQVKVIARDNKALEVNELSRGTAEQLYLALRFGFVREYAKSAGTIPLVFDDILVNFDPQRARQAAEAIHELAKDRQILFFTCHPGTVELLKKGSRKAPVWHLEDGNVVAAK